jgi:uncharacterized protein (TIGR02145 family)
MKKSIIVLIGILALTLTTCQEEHTIFDENIKPDENLAKPSFTSENAREITSITDSDYLLDLITIIEGMVDDGTLNEGNGNALISKIENVIKSIEKENTNAISGQLGSFINSTEALVNSGTLTEELGQILIDPAEEAIMLADGFFTDTINGDEYPIVKIGGQIWMAENLKATNYNDGTDIPLVEDENTWVSLSTPAYCWYYNDESTYGNTYGALYNWYTAETGKLCPTGWHVPSDAEWTTLTDYLGGESVAGGKLKETGTEHWLSPNIGATNETGFTALPGGYRSYDGPFNNIGRYGYWWSASEYDTYLARRRSMCYNNSNVPRDLSSKKIGFSVRCLRD